MLSVEWIISFLALGCFVGFMAGLLGIGGGGIMVPILTTIFLAQGVGTDSVVHLALGTSMASIIVTSFASLRAHNQKNAVLWNVVKSMAVGIILGTFIATFIAAKINSTIIAIFFAVFMGYLAYKMFKDTKPKPSRELAGSTGLFAAGSGIGAISALVSIGGGSLTVPFLIWQNVDARKAIGTSAAIGLPISIAGTLGYMINGWSQTVSSDYTFGFVYIPAVILISATSFFCAPLGVKFAHKMPVPTLKKIIAVLMVLLSIKMLTSVI